jgi:hypothetical protein
MKLTLIFHVTDSSLEGGFTTNQSVNKLHFPVIENGIMTLLCAPLRGLKMSACFSGPTISASQFLIM